MTALDIEEPGALARYLGDADGTRTVVTTLTGGVSNRTVLVRRDGQPDIVVKQALDRLRVATEWRADVRRIHTEARGLRWIAELCGADSVPAVVFEDHRQHVLGMTAVPQPHDNLKDVLLRGEVDLSVIRALATLLATVHVRSASRSAELASVFADRSTFEELRLAPYYAYTAERVPGAHGFLHDLTVSTRTHRLALVHGDYSPKNVLVHHGRLVLLDHEAVHFGDPAFDIGFSLTHLLSKAHHVRSREMSDAASEYGRTYLRAAGRLATPDLEARAVRHTVACLMARVAGRSPLEYLGQRSRERQLEVAVRLATEPPDTVDSLVGRFFRLLSERGWPQD